MVRVCIPLQPSHWPYACVPQANRCSSKARFVDATLPVLMQTSDGTQPTAGKLCNLFMSPGQWSCVQALAAREHPRAPLTSA